MNPAWLSAVTGIVLSASLVFAEAGAGGSPSHPIAPGLPDHSGGSDGGSLGGDSRSGRLDGRGSDDGTATDPTSTLPHGGRMNDERTRGSTGPGSADTGDEPGPSVPSTGR
jgi:hypothetical protein